MRKLLIFFAVMLLAGGCASLQKADYKSELKENRITKSEYNYLMHGQKELNGMRSTN